MRSVRAAINYQIYMNTAETALQLASQLTVGTYTQKTNSYIQQDSVVFYHLKTTKLELPDSYTPILNIHPFISIAHISLQIFRSSPTN